VAIRDVTVLASDFHLKPSDPRGIAAFVAFARELGTGARRLCLLGDLFEYWIGPKQLRDAAHDPIFDALAALAAQGTEVLLFHGNRDFLLGAAEARRAGGRVVGEEHALDLHGRRCLLLHGDSLCTRDVEYQRSKVWLRSRALFAASRVVPEAIARAVARRLRAASTKSVARKDDFTLGIVPQAAAARFAEGYAALVCGHVHQPGIREIDVGGGVTKPLYVLGDWHDDGGIFAIADASGIRLERFAL
jgi:UDP-2,3-diacylglucosamine hydrolase